MSFLTLSISHTTDCESAGSVSPSFLYRVSLDSALWAVSYAVVSKDKVVPSGARTLTKLIFPSVFLGGLLLLSANFNESSVESPWWPAGLLSFKFASKLLSCALTTAIMFFCYRLTTTVGFDLLRKGKDAKPLPRILKSMVGIAYFILGGVITLYIIMEGEGSGILAFSGALSIVLGIALRPMILDVFSGLSANLESAFQIGDWIGVEGNSGSYEGCVEQINWRSTDIRTRAGNIVVCPNSYLSTSIVTNYSRPQRLSRYEVNVMLPCEVPVDRVRPVILQAVQSSIGKPGGPSASKQPDVLVSSIAGSGIKYWVRFWLDPTKASYDAAIDVVSESVNTHLMMAGIPLAVSREEVRHVVSQANSGYMEQADSRFEVIRALELFRGLSEKSLRKVAESVDVERYRPNRSIITQGDAGTDMYILSEGVLRVEILKDGVPLQIDTIEPGQFFGEMSLLTDEPRSATITCETDCVVFVVDRSVMRQLMDESPKCMEVLSSNLASRKMNQQNALTQTSVEESVEEERKLSRAIFEKMKGLFRGSRAPLPQEKG